MGWEDGLHISEDGLHLYCTYVPIDLLSFSLNGSLPNSFSTNYLRGAPDFGMDLITNPISATEWLHSDILYSNRATIADSFTTWQLSNMDRPFYSEGAPTPNYNEQVTSVDIMLFTSNDNASNNMDIWFITNTYNNPSGIGTALPSPITTGFNEDNPHLVDLQNDTLILFYDSDNLPGGLGDIDIWYTTSYDDGQSWDTAINVSSVNTNTKEHQPFIHYDNTTEKYYLYYSTYHSDNKLAIFRKEQLIENDWDSWGNNELVISAGNAAGIGEPTLTTNGDISFVVVYEDPELNSIYNRFDSDPWYLRKKNTASATNDLSINEKEFMFYPNPTDGLIHFRYTKDASNLKIYDSQGSLYYEGLSQVIDMKEFPRGLYYLTLITNSGSIVTKTLIKN